MPDVKPRRYVSSLRRRQAAASRSAVLDAARELFLEQGYAGTTVEQIAARAGVSKPTVFSAVGNKQMVFKTVRDVAMAGDDEPVPVLQRPSALAIDREPDPYLAVERLAEHVTAVVSRYAALDDVLRQAAAAGERELRELWEAGEGQRLVGAAHYVDSLAAKGPLREGVDRATAIDMLWLLMAPDLYHRMVAGRGWTAERYRAWLASALRLQLLPVRS